MVRLAALLGFAIAAGAAAAVLRTDRDGHSKAVGSIQDALAPVADLLPAERGPAGFAPDPVTGRPTSAFDAFFDGRTPDPVARACQNGDSAETTRAVIVEHAHLATARFVHCLLSREPKRFCAPAGRTQAAAALELYNWARDAAEHPPRRRATAEPTMAGDDREDRVWDGARDRMIVDDVKTLLRRGYLDAGAFGLLPDRRTREIIDQTPREADACAAPD